MSHTVWLVSVCNLEPGQRLIDGRTITALEPTAAPNVVGDLSCLLTLDDGTTLALGGEDSVHLDPACSPHPPMSPLEKIDYMATHGYAPHCPTRRPGSAPKLPTVVA